MKAEIYHLSGVAHPGGNQSLLFARVDGPDESRNLLFAKVGESWPRLKSVISQSLRPSALRKLDRNGYNQVDRKVR